MKTIIVGYDDTERSERALERGVTLARALGAALIVATVAPEHVHEPHAEPQPLPRLELAGPSELWDHATQPPDVDPSLLALEKASARLAALGFAAELVAPVGKTAAALVQLAEERRADLIVVGNHAPGMLERLVAHGVSDEVSHRARCDVLIVR